MNDVPFLYYGMVCFALTLLGLVLTVLEFRSTSSGKHPIDPQR